MPQLGSQTFKLQGCSFNINVQDVLKAFFRIELVGGDNESGEELAGISESKIDVDDPTLDKNVAPAQKNESEKDQVNAMAKLKERLELAEMNCSMLEELYLRYRVRWLEENYRVRALKVYAPDGVNTHSPRQITCDAPSPAQSEYDAELQGQE
ncbi:hypothetical protein DEU56DRAFT_755830 [Suillus clintonianus]|uniref:uncharacterized protein n=1 Tax=Suillus clintonianus TaxID=1904413 RepID=UPI001B8730D2|nr:uncharacterized protein DEU56DRAFT_755830 [Suillus clintonianus]KAG2138539.1 hypothetical protein DEU56DRAFT_755830 [Suillus clintonianus]